MNRERAIAEGDVEVLDRDHRSHSGSRATVASSVRWTSSEGAAATSARVLGVLRVLQGDPWRRIPSTTLAAIHDEHPVAETRNHRQVVADENQPHATLAHQIVEDAEDFVLHRHIEGGGRLIRDEEIGLGHQHHGDHDALTHAAGELMRIEMVDEFGIADLHGLKHCQGALAGFVAADAQMQKAGLADLLADGFDRIERIFRVLHNHRHAPAAQVLPVALGATEQVVAITGHRLGGDNSGAGHEAQQGAARGRFSRSGFTDDAEPLAPQREAVVAHRLRQRPDRPGEADVQGLRR